MRRPSMARLLMTKYRMSKIAAPKLKMSALMAKDFCVVTLESDSSVSDVA